MKKTLLITTLAAALAVNSMIAFAATNTSNIQTTNLANASAPVNNATQGDIEYSKETISNANGDICSTKETWVDSTTHDRRFDLRSGTSLFESLYSTDNGTQVSKVLKDANGNTTSGSTVTLPAEKVADYYKTYDNGYFTKDLFTALKDNYTQTDWKDEGIAYTADGKTLKKISKTEESAEGNTSANITNVNTINYIYLDENSGLPIKSESYAQKNGTMSLEYSSTFEYKTVNNDGYIFNTSGMNLQNEKLDSFEKILSADFGIE